MKAIIMIKYLCVTGVLLFLAGCSTGPDKMQSDADGTQIIDRTEIESFIKKEIPVIESAVLEIARNEEESALSGTLSEEMKKPDWVWLEENDDETGFTMEGLPFLEFYYPEDGELFLKLYYDEETGTGSGISYGYGAENNKIGFYFYNTKEWDFALEEKYDFSRWIYFDDGITDVQSRKDFDGITNYHEQIEYHENGKPLHYEAIGDYERYEWETDYVMIEIDYDYRDDGSIFSKRCLFDPWLFGTGESMRTIYYDKSGRVVYMEEYITHGDIQRYYIYDGDEDIPAYCFVFDSGWDAFMVKYK